MSKNKLTDDQVLLLVAKTGWATGDWQPRKKCFKYRVGDTKLDAAQIERLRSNGQLKPLTRWPGDGIGLEVKIDKAIATMLLAQDIEKATANAQSGFLKPHKAFGVASTWMSLAYLANKPERTRDDVLRYVESALLMEGFRSETVVVVADLIWAAFVAAHVA